jgi:hypothetical protein
MKFQVGKKYTSTYTHLLIGEWECTIAEITPTYSSWVLTCIKQGDKDSFKPGTKWYIDEANHEKFYLINKPKKDHYPEFF